MSREAPAPFCERPEGNFLWPTHHGLHWALDVIFDEDHHRFQSKLGAANLSLLRKVALAILSEDKTLKCGRPAKQMRAATSPSYREHLLKKSFYGQSPVQQIFHLRGNSQAFKITPPELTKDLNVMRQLLIFLFCLSNQGLTIEPSSEERIGQQAPMQVLLNHDRFTPEEVESAFRALLFSSSKAEPNCIPYCNQDEIRIMQEVPASLYKEIINSMPICCVDVFVYNFKKQAYLMIKRDNSPGKGWWWIPGGRIFKGESFYESAIRKTKMEVGIDIVPLAQLGTYSTYFAESAWGTGVHTDTKNTVVLALCSSTDTHLDDHHQDVQWIPIDQAPTDPYLLKAYGETVEKLEQLGFNWK